MQALIILLTEMCIGALLSKSMVTYTSWFERERAGPLPTLIVISDNFQPPNKRKWKRKVIKYWIKIAKLRKSSEKEKKIRSHRYPQLNRPGFLLGGMLVTRVIVGAIASFTWGISWWFACCWAYISVIDNRLILNRFAFRINKFYCNNFKPIHF